MSAAASPLTGRSLTPSEAATLRTIIARNPDASKEKLRELFGLATGRYPSLETVWRYRHAARGRPVVRNPRRKSYKVQPADRSTWFPELDAAEREALLAAMDENPGLAPIEVVALFVERMAWRRGIAS